MHDTVTTFWRAVFIATFNRFTFNVVHRRLLRFQRLFSYTHVIDAVRKVYHVGLDGVGLLHFTVRHREKDGLSTIVIRACAEPSITA